MSKDWDLKVETLRIKRLIGDENKSIYLRGFANIKSS